MGGMILLDSTFQCFMFTQKIKFNEMDLFSIILWNGRASIKNRIFHFSWIQIFIKTPCRMSDRRKKRTMTGIMRSMQTRSYHGREMPEEGSLSPSRSGSQSVRNYRVAKSVHLGSQGPNQLTAEQNTSFRLKECFSPLAGYYFSLLRYSFLCHTWFCLDKESIHHYNIRVGH